MARPNVAGAATAAAAFAATTGLAFDGGGFPPVSWDRWLVIFAALALIVLLLAGAEAPGRPAAALLAALGLLTAWAAASWLWSDSPPAAPEEAQRIALYLAAAAAVVVAGRRAPLGAVAGGIAAGVAPVAGWNLALRLAPDWTGRAPQRTDIGSLADPVGYANALGLLLVLGMLLALGVAAATGSPALRAAAAVLLVPYAADVALQESSGAFAALAAGVAALVLADRRGLAAVGRSLLLLVLPLGAAAGVALSRGVVSPPPEDLTSAAHPGHRLLLMLVLLASAQLVAARFVLPRLRAAGPLLPGRAAVAAAVVLALAAAAAAPFALRGHDRGAYWRAATHEIAANPLLGSGAGTYVDWWLRTRTTDLSTREAHSLYLETLAELGPLGLLALLAALGVPLAAALRLRRTAWGPPLLAVLVAYDVHAAADFDWELGAATVPAVLVGAVAAVHAAAPHAAARARSWPRLAAVVGLTGLTAAGILALAGNARLASARDAEAVGAYDATIRYATRALRYAPWSADAWSAIGEARLAQGDHAGAREAFRSAVRLDPNDWQAWLELAQASTGEARRSAEAEAARLNPLGPGP